MRPVSCPQRQPSGKRWLPPELEVRPPGASTTHTSRRSSRAEGVKRDTLSERPLAGDVMRTNSSSAMLRHYRSSSIWNAEQRVSCADRRRSEEHTSELQSPCNLV